MPIARLRKRRSSSSMGSFSWAGRWRSVKLAHARTADPADRHDPAAASADRVPAAGLAAEAAAEPRAPAAVTAAPDPAAEDSAVRAGHGPAAASAAPDPAALAAR